MPTLSSPKEELIAMALKAFPGEGMKRTPISALQIARTNSITGPTPVVYTPAICFIIQGEKDALVGGKVYHYTEAQFLLNSVALPVTGSVTKATAQKPYLCLVLDLDATLVYDLLKNTESLPKAKVSPSKGIFVEPVNPDLTDAFLRLMRCLDNSTDTAILAPLIIREITYRLLTSSFGEAIQQIGIKGSQTQQVAKVIARLRKDYAQNFKIEDLAKISGMSPSTFHQHFKLVTGMSPLQYQKHIRLQEARKLLVAELSDASSAAFHVGYESASQFSREYARLFGLPPISDIKRMRAL